MYKRRGNDNSGPKILGNEKRPFWYSYTLMPLGVNWKHSAYILTVSLRHSILPSGRSYHTYQKETQLI